MHAYRHVYAQGRHVPHSQSALYVTLASPADCKQRTKNRQKASSIIYNKCVLYMYIYVCDIHSQMYIHMEILHPEPKRFVCYIAVASRL